MTTKSKKDKKKTPPEDKQNQTTVDKGTKDQTPSEELEDTPPEKLEGDPPEEIEGDPPPEELEATATVSPSAQLLEIAIYAWMGHMMHPLMYHLTRAFAHYSAGEPYGTTHVFRNFRGLPKGVDELLSKMMDFKDEMIKEWEEYPNGRIIHVAGKPSKH